MHHLSWLIAFIKFVIILYPLYFPLLWFWLCRNSWALRPFRWGLNHQPMEMVVVWGTAGSEWGKNLWFYYSEPLGFKIMNYVMCNAHIVANLCVFSYLRIWWITFRYPSVDVFSNFRCQNLPQGKSKWHVLVRSGLNSHYFHLNRG